MCEARCHQYWVMSSPTSRIITIPHQGKLAQALALPGNTHSIRTGAAKKMAGTVIRMKTGVPMASIQTSRAVPLSLWKKAAGHNFQKRKTGKNQRHEQFCVQRHGQSPVDPDAARVAIT